MIRFGNFSNMFMWLLSIGLDWSEASPDTFMENFNFVNEWKHDRVKLSLNSKSVEAHTAEPLPLSRHAHSPTRRKLVDLMTEERWVKLPKPSGWTDKAFDWRGLVDFKHSSHQNVNECFAESAAVTMDALYQLAYGRNNDSYFNPDQLLLCSGHNYGQTGLPEEVFNVHSKWSPSAGCHPHGDETIQLAHPALVLCDLSGDENIENSLVNLLTFAPVNVAIPSGNRVFKNYKSGILSPNHLATKTNVPDHSVALVGFGTEKGLDYWTLKNSWGSQWGEDGYFRLERRYDGSGALGSYATVTKLI